MLKQTHELELDPNFPHEAIDAIERTLNVGAKKYKPANWRTESHERHLIKMLSHFIKYVAGLETDGEDSLEHMLCRAAMAVATRPQTPN